MYNKKTKFFDLSVYGFAMAESGFMRAFLCCGKAKAEPKPTAWEFEGTSKGERPPHAYYTWNPFISGRTGGISRRNDESGRKYLSSHRPKHSGWLGKKYAELEGNPRSPTRPAIQSAKQ